ncbi:MAG: hypothetical protein AAF570_02230 [Bacteroidota bacterium]
MITSFFSYKGGSGRTQLVANLAAYLSYRKNRKVLLIDWDLEAPGLDYFFKLPKEKFEKGVIDLFYEYVDGFMNEKFKSEADLPYFSSEYIVPVNEDKKNGRCLHYIPAGKWDDDYASRVSSFNWKLFYENLDGMFFVEHLKKKLMEADYDHVFIDSRTGLNDYAGICNIQLPKVNVIVVTPTRQSFDGSLKVIQKIQTSDYVLSDLRGEPVVFPILSRIDLSLEETSVKWSIDFKFTFRDELQNLTETIPNLTVDEYVQDTKLAYKRDLGAGEPLLFSVEASPFVSEGGSSLRNQYMSIGDLIEATNPDFGPSRREAFAMVKGLVAKGKTSEALVAMYDLLPIAGDKWKDDLILLQSQMANLQSMNIQGILSTQEYLTESTRVNKGILRLMANIERSIKEGRGKKDALVKILHVTASSREETLETEREIKRIQLALHESDIRERFELHVSRFTTPETIVEQLLKVSPRIVHFSGLGTEDGIYLEGQLEKPVLFLNERLKSLFAHFGERIECLILASDHSIHQAKGSSEYVDYVVATKDRVHDSAYLAFVSGFYKSLAAGEGYEVSFEFARLYTKMNEDDGAAEKFVLFRQGELWE